MPAMADDPYAVLRTSGLLGTWSQDCSTEAMTGSMTLVRFTMTSLGAPLVTVGGPDFIMYSAMIEAAAPVAGGQISLTVDGGLSGAPAQVMLRMQAGALQIMQAGVWGSPLRRCISE
jgi:hypothetical protein